MNYERDFNNDQLRELAAIAQTDQEEKRKVDELVIDFEKAYIKVVFGTENIADLYSGDFKSGVRPLSLMTSHSTRSSIDYEELKRRFIEIIGDKYPSEEELERMGRSIEVTQIPEDRTLYLKSLAEGFPQRELPVSKTEIKLKSESSDALLLTIDRYFYPEGTDVAFAETWTLRRMKAEDSPVVLDKDSRIPEEKKVLKPQPVLLLPEKTLTR